MTIAKQKKRGRRFARTLAAAAATAAALAIATPASAGGELAVGVNDLSRQGNPFAGRGTPGVFVWAALFDTLAQPDASGAPQPVLATGWTNVDPLTWRFALRSGITFSNGKPFDAAAAAFAFEFLMTEEGQASVVGREFRNLASVRVVDASTIEVVTKTPDPIILNRLSMLYIVEPGAWKDMGVEGFTASPVGTGAFTAAEFKAEEALLTARRDAWQTPGLDSVRLISLPERASRLQALQSGQINLAFGLSTDNIAALEGAGLTVLVSPAPQVMSITLRNVNNDGSPVLDQRVRQALNYAVNKELMANELLAGFAKAASHGGTPAAFGYNPNLKPYPYDPAKARSLLAEAGYANGFDMTIEVVTGSFPSDSEIYQQVAADLGKVGINVNLKQIAFPEWLKKFLANEWDGAGFGLSWNSSPYMDSVRPFGYQTCAKRNPHFCDESMTPLYDQVNAEFDPEKRKRLLWDLHAMAREVAPAIFLVEQIDVTGIAKNVAGFEYVNRLILYPKISIQ
jgi:peptide/nickel transport system substrate-binding protein